MLAEFMGISWLFWWQIPLLITFLACWLIVTPLLLWVGGKYIVKAPAATFGRCVLAILLAGVASLIVGLIPFIGWLVALFVTWLIIMWMLKTSFGKAILAWLPTLANAIIIVPLLVAMLLPSLGRARELAKRTICMNNLNSIGKSCLVYCEMNKGIYPPDLEILLQQKILEPKEMFQCSSSKIDGVSYFYLTPQPGAPSTIVIACDYAVNHNSEMRNVLFADGHAEPMNSEKFAEAMARPENARFAAALAEAERNLPVRPPKG